MSTTKSRKAGPPQAEPESIPVRCVHCVHCGAPEKVNAAGYSNLSPYSRVCVNCLNRAMGHSMRRHGQ